MQIGELNRRVTLKSWTSTQDAAGGSSALQILSYPIWAKVEARSGAPFTSEEQQVWNYDYKITMRYEKSRVVKSNFTVDYDSKRLRINSISFSEEGNRKLSVLRCSTIDADIDTLKDIDIVSLIRTFNYYGTGGEDNFTQTANPDLRGKTILGAFKDGIEFAVLLSGTPSPLAKEVVYNSTTGNFLWSIPYDAGEHTLIQYF